MNYLEQILWTVFTSSLTTAMILAVAAFIGRSIIDRWFTKDLEKYKVERQRINTIEYRENKKQFGY